MGEEADRLIEQEIDRQIHIGDSEPFDGSRYRKANNNRPTIAELVEKGLMTDFSDGRHENGQRRVTCDICQATNLNWSMNLGKWSLRDSHGFWHKCYADKVKLSL